jgi:hypothetical protein
MSFSAPLMKRYGHNIKNLTNSEILLAQVYERRDAARRASFAEAQAERKLLGSMSMVLSQRSVISTGKSIITPTASSQDTASEKEAYIDEKVTPEETDVRKESGPDRDFASASATRKEAASHTLQLHSHKKGGYLETVFGTGARSDSDDEGEKHVVAKRRTDINSAVKETEAPKKLERPVLKKRQLKDSQNADEDEGEVIIDMDTLDSTALYSEGFLSVEKWDPLFNTAPKTHILNGFGIVEEGKGVGMSSADARPNNTLVLQLSVPPNAKRWAVNIGPEHHNECAFIFLHFNPRYSKSQLVLNNKAGTWGAGRKVRFNSSSKDGSGSKGAAALLSTNIELMISVRENGFACFANGECCCFFPHRTDISKLERLACVLPRTDDNGVVETVVFHKVWWGFRDPALDIVPRSIIDMHLEEIEMFLESRSKSQTEDSSCKLEVTGLPKYTEPTEVMALERVVATFFQPFAPTGCHIDAGTGKCYLQFATLETCLEALDEMGGGVTIEENGKPYDLEISRLSKKF